MPYEELYAEAAAAGPGAGGLLALPYFAGERTPLFDPDLRGALAGLTAAHGRGHVFRALMEAAAFAVRHNLETMAEAGATIAVLRSGGGGAAGALWPQIVSDVTGLAQDVREGPSQAGVGAALLAAVAVGAATLQTTWPRATVHVRARPGDAAAVRRALRARSASSRDATRPSGLTRSARGSSERARVHDGASRQMRETGGAGTLLARGGRND